MIGNCCNNLSKTELCILTNSKFKNGYTFNLKYHMYFNDLNQIIDLKNDKEIIKILKKYKIREHCYISYVNIILDDIKDKLFYKKEFDKYFTVLMDLLFIGFKEPHAADNKLRILFTKNTKLKNLFTKNTKLEEVCKSLNNESICENCDKKNSICKPGQLTNSNGDYIEALGGFLLNDIDLTKDWITKKDIDLFEILSNSNVTNNCYYEYALYIHNLYKDKSNFKGVPMNSVFRNLIDMLYWSFGSPGNDKNILRNISKKNIKNNKELILKTKIKNTTLKSVTTVRNGQGGFRSNLLKLYGECVICGLSMENLLKASHIKRWEFCNDAERLDPYNGLLLCPCQDEPFDKGYITFDDDGKIIISKLLDEQACKLLNINPNIQIKMHEKTKKYMKWHREQWFVDNRNDIT